MVIRTFFAIDLEEKELINKIEIIQSQFNFPDARIVFVAPENLHFTLKFLGDIEEGIVPELEKAAQNISFSDFELELSGIGCLPNYSYINALYIGVTKGLENLASIAKELESLSNKFNFKKEIRPFRAHLTIGRVKRIRDKNPLISKIKENEETYFGKINISSFKLKKSDLTPQGPLYTNLFEVKSTK